MFYLYFHLNPPDVYLSSDEPYNKREYPSVVSNLILVYRVSIHDSVGPYFQFPDIPINTEIRRHASS